MIKKIYSNGYIETSNMQEIPSNELNYRPVMTSEPDYEWTRIFPQSGGTTTTVTIGGNDMIF